MSRPPLLWVIIGPNGAGKSTYYDFKVRPRLQAEFINADRLAVQHFGSHDPSRSYDAARLATERREQLLDAGRSMVFETVFSHPSKLAFCRAARKRGYEVWVSLIMLDSATRCVERVQDRVRRGGHPVPEPKIRARYERMQGLAKPALAEASKGWVLDNSDSERPLRVVAKLAYGTRVWVCEPSPSWLGRVLVGGP